jgi:succinyl-diaminopimelate desuccinylase
MTASLELAKALIRCPSLTPADAGCQKIIAYRLQNLGFSIEKMCFGEVENLWARLGKSNPLIVFAGHTDVVPTGPLSAWQYNPFEPLEKDGILYGRGATDMKSGLACMIVAAENFIKKNPSFPGSIAFLITSDEEGPSQDGTRRVIEVLQQRHEKIHYCIIGEASSEKKLGDQIRVGRRGSFHGKLKIYGKQGHVAFPQHAKNPIHLSMQALHHLAQEKWDQGNDFFPPTTFQISNIHAGTGATNVIPGYLEAQFNFRYSTAVTPDELKLRVNKILDQYQLNFDIDWDVSAQPFLTHQGKLISVTQQAIKAVTSLETQLSTGGGTSDGRFIAPTGAEIIELGPLNSTAHQVNEQTSIADLDKLTLIYENILAGLFAQN